MLLYAIIVTGKASSGFWLLMAAFLGLGFANIFLAFNVVHDACHHAFSSSKAVNMAMGYTMNFIGGNQYLFTMMHRAHHSFVNIAGSDVTLETHGLFRFTPHEPWQPKHRWQHIYTPIVYALAMLHWVLVKDFKWIFGETSIGNKKQIKHSPKEFAILFASKIFYYGVTLILPMMLLSVPWWWVTIAWVNMHILPGLCFALLFQVTHIYSGTHYPIPDKDGNILNNYFIHVLETTADFSRKDRFVTWLTGGINIHVVHHLFPNINHAHYIPLTHIVKQTAEEFGMQYQENPNFWVALKLHMKMLKYLSRKDACVPQYGSSSALA
jgi:linoleoyl-CoA desaturase